MRTFIIIGSILGVVIAGISIIIWLRSRPLTKAEAIKKINFLLKKEIAGNNTVTTSLVLIDSDKYGLNEYFTVGELEDRQLEKNQPFHVASVGKSFTAVLVAMLIEEGRIKLQDKLLNYLNEDFLVGLFVVNGKDYNDEVTIGQLLSHTSGAADYYNDPVINSKTMAELVIEEPDRFWKPKDLIDFSRYFQETAGKPGEIFHYSDTGYILLGLLIEEVSGKHFHELLHERIFNPLKMANSYLIFYSEPENEKIKIADIWFNGTEISNYRSLSIDWSGGGIVSTLDDLAVFIRALNNNELITEKTLDIFYKFEYKFMTGIHYGLGFMEYNFKEYFPTLGFLPDMRGHMGVLGTQMIYDKDSDTVFIASFGSTDYSAGSVKTMIKILTYTARIEN